MAEWDTRRKRRTFVAFEKKVLEYPAVYGQCLGLSINFSDDPDALFLVGDGKDLRDSLTHQSPYIAPQTKQPEKLARMSTISVDVIERVVSGAVAYVRKVEVALGHNPAKSTPWLRTLA